MNRLRNRPVLIVELAVALGLLALVGTNPAEAAFPDTNGQIAHNIPDQCAGCKGGS